MAGMELIFRPRRFGGEAVWVQIHKEISVQDHPLRIIRILKHFNSAITPCNAKKFLLDAIGMHLIRFACAFERYVVDLR